MQQDTKGDRGCCGTCATEMTDGLSTVCSAQKWPYLCPDPNNLENQLATLLAIIANSFHVTWRSWLKEV